MSHTKDSERGLVVDTALGKKSVKTKKVTKSVMYFGCAKKSNTLFIIIYYTILIQLTRNKHQYKAE